MITFQAALKTVLRETTVLPATRVGLDNALGYFLAGPVTAAFDMPRFDNSAVDGYGVRVRDVSGASAETPVVMNLVGTVRAGVSRSPEMKPKGAVKLFTGASIPRGVEAVVMREWADEGSELRLTRTVERGENIRRRGEEFDKGDELLPSGTLITPAVVGLLSTFGFRSCRTFRKPAVRIITVGDEINPPQKALRGSQIFDSVGPALVSCCQELRIPDTSLKRVGDSQRRLVEVFGKAVEQADVIITVGGVSVGDYDITKQVFENHGVQRCYWQVAMKPGKPNYFGVLTPTAKRKLLVFGLPGNPVAALLSFQLLIRPALLKMMSGTAPVPTRIRATLTSALRKKPGRLEFVRGLADLKDGEWVVTAVRGQESHMLGGLARANCLICFDAESTHLPRGAKVMIEPLSFS